jgi:hypothetical protein
LGVLAFLLVIISQVKELRFLALSNFQAAGNKDVALLGKQEFGGIYNQVKSQQI